MNRATNWLAAVVLFLCWLALVSPGANADDKVDRMDKIKALQKRRLEAAIKARDYLMEQYKQRYLPPGAADTGGFLNQLLETNELVFHARLDLCDGKQSRLELFHPLWHKTAGLLVTGSPVCDPSISGSFG